MSQPSHTSVQLEFLIFETEFGWLALTWSAIGLRRLIFPQPTEALARTQVLKRTPQANESVLSHAPLWIRRLTRDLQTHLREGAPVQLSEVNFDLSEVPPFHFKVYEEAVKISRGETVSYGELARRAGSPKAARAVGQAMARNPLPLLIPCHRVLAEGGKLGGFTAPGGTITKTRLLNLERPEGVSAKQMSLLL